VTSKRAESQQSRADAQQERSDAQQERIDIAAHELAGVSERLQSAATAPRINLTA